MLSSLVRAFRTFALLAAFLAAGPSFAIAQEKQPEALAGTQPLEMQGDIASQLVEGVDKFLLRKIDESVAKRERHWKRDFSSPEAYNKSIEPNRKRLAHILGMRDARAPGEPSLFVSDMRTVTIQGSYAIIAFRSAAVGTIHVEGLALVPTNPNVARANWPSQARISVIAIPDADQTPEQLVGLVEGVPAELQFARRLAESGCAVIVPSLVSREVKARNGRAKLTNREYLYRPAFELGRHLIGYELQKILTVIDWLNRKPAVVAGQNAGDDAPAKPEADKIRIGVIGYGEGGMLALYAGALDPRIDAVAVSGYFENRNSIWQQPIDRNVFGLLDQFGDAELAAMIAPRALYVSAGPGIELTLPGEGGAPARLTSVNEESMFAEWRRAGELVAGFRGKVNWPASAAGKTITDPEKRKPDMPPPKQPAFGDIQLGQFLNQLSTGAKLAELGPVPKPLGDKLPDAAARQQRQVDEIDRFTQQLLVESPYVRAEFMKKLYDVASTKNLAEYEKVADEYRKTFYDDVIGRFDDPLLPPNPRTRKAYDKEKWTGYEVVLDVWPDVFAYGILLVPKDIKEGEKRPVVVCQHGLEGRPQDVVAGDNPAYHDFAARLAERGFVTFAPQNLYIFTDRFRTLQRKANPLGKTLFSIIVPQHQQITDWLKTLPFVDGERIGFYGLSYGGKSAMRIPPLVKNYCLSICSADFNEWVWKNASTRSPYSYVWNGEYEIFEFDLGSTFNYAEMAALIAPRPFMVERGHFDGVAPDETVGYEFAKVRHHYAARLGLGDRCEIDWFVGPHTINGKGTFDFLHKHLSWPQK